jgi:hypothetical protein
MCFSGPPQPQAQFGIRQSPHSIPVAPSPVYCIIREDDNSATQSLLYDIPQGYPHKPNNHPLSLPCALHLRCSSGTIVDRCYSTSFHCDSCSSLKREWSCGCLLLLLRA